jgi:hypothetical protein
MISCVKAMVKIRMSLVMYDAYKTKHLRKFHRVEKDVVRFEVKVTIKFEFKIFSTGNRQHKLFHVNFWCSI